MPEAKKKERISKYIAIKYKNFISLYGKCIKSNLEDGLENIYKKVEIAFVIPTFIIIVSCGHAARHVRLLNTEQLYFKHKCRERLYIIALLTLSVSQFLRDIHFPYRTYRHMNECFRPAFDYLICTQ